MQRFPLSILTTNIKGVNPKTGGEFYEIRLAEILRRSADATIGTIRYRWYLLHCAPLALLVKYFQKFLHADVYVQGMGNDRLSFWLPWLFKKLNPKGKFLTLLFHPLWLEDPRWFAAESRVLRLADGVIVISETIAMEIRKAAPCIRTKIIRPGYLPVPARPKLDPPLILWSGHLLERKGPQHLLGALRTMGEQKWCCTFVATTKPDQEFERRFLEELNSFPPEIRSRITVAHRLSRGDYLDLIGNASLYCLPSRVEGYSISTLEAMSAGVAVVLPRLPIFVELVGDKDYPWFFDEMTPEAIARCLERLIANKEELQEAAALCGRRAAELPNWESFDEKTWATFRDFVNSGTPLSGTDHSSPRDER